ncbi:MAG: hypothetical protein M3270_03730 [Thermoproteota archaeon]|nr:hypothetical protein [Thermoproteota archaeon]
MIDTVGRKGIGAFALYVHSSGTAANEIKVTRPEEPESRAIDSFEVVIKVS